MKTIMIAGASSGIGYALAKQLIDKQCGVISISRTMPDLPVAMHLSYDVMSEEQPPEIEIPLTGLVYCPGSIQLKPFKSLKQSDFLRDWEVNCMGAIKVIQKYLPNLKAASNSSIVLFSTVAVGTGMLYHSSIAAAKGAVEGLGRSLAAELAPNIRVNVIAPSLVKTPLSAKLTDADTKLASAIDRHPLKRIGNADEVAALAAFLLSEDAGWITGQVIKADGGISSVKL